MLKQLRRIHNHKGQALAEMAVLGSIILVVIGAMVSYGQLLNAQHDAQMYAFRRALYLADKRFDDGAFGQVSLTVQREFPSANILENKPGIQQAGGSASVLWDSMQNFYERDSIISEKLSSLSPEDINALQDDSGITYQQLGEDMINNDRYILTPTMAVWRRPDPAKPKNFFETFLDILFGMSGDNDEPYASVEAAPYSEEETNTTSAYDSTKNRVQAGSQINSQEEQTLIQEGITQYHINEDYLDPAKREKWDDKIVAIISMPGDMTISSTVSQEGDQIVDRSIRIERTKQWQTNTKE